MSAPWIDDIRFTVAQLLEEERERTRVMIREELARASTAGDPDDLWAADRVAKALGSSPVAVRRAHERGTLGVEAVRVGKRSLRWRAGDVRALARSRASR